MAQASRAADPRIARASRVATAVGVGGCATVGMLFFAQGNPSIGPLLLAVAVAAATAGIPFFVAAGRGRLDLFEPSVLLSVFSLVGFCLSAVAAAALGRQFDSGQALPHFPAALGVAALGLGSWFLGYYGGPGGGLARALPPLPRGWTARRVVIGALAFGIAGLLAKIVSLVRGGYLHGFSTQIGGRWSTAASWIGDFTLVALTLVAVRHYQLVRAGRPSWTWRIAFFCLMLLSLAYAVPSGWRHRVLEILLVPLIVAYYILGRVRWRIIAAAGALVVFVVFPLTNLYRIELSAETQAGLRHPSTASVAQLLQAAAQTARGLKGVSASEYASLSLRTFVERLSMVQIVAAIIRRTPSVWPFEHGRTLQAFVTSLTLPRFVMAKPVVTVGGIAFAHRYHMIQPGDTLTSVAPTRIGELYLNFWLPGVAGLMWIEGMLSRFVYTYLIDRGARSPVGVVLYTVFVLVFAQFTALADYALLLKTFALVGPALLWMARAPLESGND